MSYNPLIPQVSDQTLQSQKQLLSNFQTLAQVFTANHFPLTGDSKYQGMHTVLTMQPQSGDPSTDPTQIGLYNKLVSSIPALFFAPNSAQTPIQLTYPSISTIPTNLQQYSFVAGPFVIYGGSIINPTNGQTITLSPTTNLLYAGLTTSNFSGPSTFSKTPTPININSPPSSFTIAFEIQSQPINQKMYYLAIGQ